VVQVGFMQWTGNSKLRHPRLIGLREDKAAREVVRELP
jgi:bifunctional non-homologous end joining protein LigD